VAIKPKLRNHRLTTLKHGRKCSICQREWRGYPGSSCPGVIWYLRDEIPPDLYTKEEARRLGWELRKDAYPLGCFQAENTRNFRYLYRLSDAEYRPKPDPDPQSYYWSGRPPKIKIFTCPRCGHKYPEQKYIDINDGICRRCHVSDLRSISRKAAVEWAQNILQHPDMWMIFDAKIIKIDSEIEISSVATIDLLTGETFESPIKLQQHIPRMTQLILGIDNQVIENAPTFPVVFQNLQEIVGHRNLVTYDADFFMQTIDQTAARHNLDVQLRLYSAMEKYSGFCGAWVESKKQFKWQPLPNNQCNALRNCRSILRLLTRMADIEFEFPNPIPPPEIEF